MLDADSVFERLLREAANLVPKMSTPKLTNAMKFTSLLQQKLTDTVTSRLQNEKGNKQIPISNMQQISLASLFPSGLIAEPMLEESGESDTHRQQQPCADERQAVVVVTPTSSTPEVTSCTISGGNAMDCAGHSLEVTFLPPSQANCSNHLGSANEVLTSTPATTSLSGDGLVFSTTEANPLVVSLSDGTSPPSSGSSTTTTSSAGPPCLMLLPLMSHPTTPTTSNSSSSSFQQQQLTCSSPRRVTSNDLTHCFQEAGSETRSADVDESAGVLTGGYNGKLDSGGLVIEQLPATAMQHHTGNNSVEHSSFCLPNAISVACSMDMKPEPIDSGRLAMLGYKSSQPPSTLSMAAGNLSTSSIVSTATPSAACVDLVGSLSFGHPVSGGITSFSSPLLAQLPIPVSSATDTVTAANTTMSSSHELVLINVVSTAATAHPSSAAIYTPPNNKLTTSTTSTSGGATTTVLSSGATGMGGPYRCRDCDKEFRILRYLEKHRRIHTGEKPYQCCYCGRQFNDWPNMNRHKRIHTGERPYRCSVCAKTFSQPAVYNEHVKRHTGERPHICIVCAKGFPRAARLAVHMRVHTGERPYPCTSCDRRFSQPHHLAAHLRVHSGDRPYACSKCHVSFACISNLRRHRKQVHPNSPILPSELSNESSSTTANNNPGGEVVLSADEKKPSLHSLGTSNNSVTTTSSRLLADAGGGLSMADPSSSMASLAAAAAAAMSGGLLGGAALVPVTAGTSIPGLILTQGPQGTLIATAPGQFVEHHHHHQQQQQHHPGQPHLIATHAAGLPHGLTDSSGLFTVVTSTGSFSMAPPPPSSDMLFKSVSSLPSSTTLSLMLPTMLSAGAANSSSAAGAAGGPTTVTFLSPHADLTGASASGLHDAAGNPVSAAGGLVVNSASGETVYLEPLDPRLTFEHGQQHFTLATIPAASVGNPGVPAGSYPLFATAGGHPIHLQQGAGGATHIAFATSPANPGQHHQQNPSAHLLTTSPVFSSSPSQQQQQQHIYTSSGQQHQSATILFPSQQQQHHHQQQQQTVVVSAAGGPSTPSQMLHYHRTGASASNSPHAGTAGRPSSTPTTMLVPIIQQQQQQHHHQQQQQVSAGSDALGGHDSTTTAMGWPIGAAGARFVTLAAAAASGSTTVVLSPSEVASLANASTSRPASVLSPSPSTGGGGGVTAPTSSANSVTAEGNL